MTSDRSSTCDAPPEEQVGAPAEQADQIRAHWLRERVESEWHVGCDLGQQVDFTAIAAIERRVIWKRNHFKSVRKLQPTRPQYHLRHLERLERGLAYGAQAQRVAVLMHSAVELADARLVVDATGVGLPVLERMREEHLPDAIGAQIVGGYGEAVRHGRNFHVPKSLLVSRLQAAVHHGDLAVAEDLPLWEALRDELMTFRMSVTAAHNFAFGARSGRHDDLVLAVALALWSAHGRPRGIELVPTMGF